MYFDDVQIRLIILYTLISFKIAMSKERMQQVLVWGNIIDYFTMMDFINDMQDMQLIKTVEIEGEQQFDITEKGKELIGLFSDKIPLSVRDDILDSAEAVLDKIGRKQEIVADIVPVDTRKFLARCGIYEKNVPLLEVNIFAGSRKNAQEVAERFKKDAAQIYKIILEKIVE